MFVHPHCPCTRTSLDELTWLLSRAEGRTTTHLLFVVPPGAPPDWADSPLWRQAQALPDVRAALDTEGREARIFGAKVSGQVLLYDGGGRLLFRGGITAGRGHGGDCPGRAAVLACLTSSRSDPVAAPVYGCPLFQERPCCSPDQVEPCRK
jgi:hypothetical protein